MEFNFDNLFFILEKHAKKYSEPIIEQIDAKTNDPFKVLVGTILSARTKDETTQKATERLFSQVNKIKDLEKLSIEQIEKLIYPVGFYKTKAKHLKQLPKSLEKFKGEIPKTIEELIQLPGVGRKTANLVISVAFKKPAVCVDTHVHRISNRLGIVNTKSPYETEQALRKTIPKKHWNKINYLFVIFGQNTCKPISPICSKCPISKYCKKIGVKNSR